MKTTTTCEFINPTDIGDYPKQDYEFQGMICSTTNPTFEQISNNGQNFYLQKTWDYGELFIAFLIFLVILFLVSKTIFDFLFEKLVKIKRKKE